MKTVYFVRHGESVSNAGGLILGAAKTPLTERGLLQAESIAERCSRLTIDVILASPALRTRQTAEVIAKRLGKRVEYADEFLEWERGRARIGKRVDDSGIIEAEKEMFNNLSNHDWRKDDAENFADLNERARKGLELLISRREENLLLIGHGLFSRILMGRAVMGSDFTGRDCQRFLRSFKLENTGVTIMRYGTPRNPSGWEVVTWNDHAHLG
jgi:broad specificity phosphatase PhoE